MFFKNKEVTSVGSVDEMDMRWNVTEVYDKPGKDSKLLRTEKVLQYRRNYNGPWMEIWNNYNTPIFLENNK